MPVSPHLQNAASSHGMPTTLCVGVQASSGVSSGTARRTSGRLATRSSAGGSQAAGPARSTRSKSHSTASGLAAVSAFAFAMSLHVS